MHEFFTQLGWGDSADADDDQELIGFSAKQQAAFMGSTGSVNVWDGSVRSGKTFTWTLLLLAVMAIYDGSAAVVVCGKNRDSIYRNVFEPIESHALFAPIRAHVNYRQGAASAMIFGKRVHVIGANDAGSESRIRGMTIGVAFADELTILHKAFVKQLFSRLSKKTSRLFATTNPDSPAHWLLKEYLAKVPGCHHFDPKTPEPEQLPHWTYWHFTMDDNPSLSEEYKNRIAREYSGLWYNRFILGLWAAAEGAIYDMWDEPGMVVDPADMPDMARVLALGIDYGTTHPTVGILLGLGVDGRLYALDEWLPGKMTDAALSRDLLTKRNEWADKGWVPEWTYVDPAAASFSLQLWEDQHPDLAKANNDVLDGIRTVASLLDNDQLKVSSTCTKLIEEMPGYRWDDKAATRGIDQPVKDIDDAVDGLRYSVFSSRWEWSHSLTTLLETQ